MGLFSFFSGKKEESESKQKVSGRIGFYGLSEWWLESFSVEEQKYIDTKYQPLTLGDPSNRLLVGDISWSSASVVNFLWGLAGWFDQAEEISVAKRIIDKAELLIFEGNAMDKHFLYGTKIKIYYKRRENPEYLELALEACRQQIAISEQAKEAFLKQSKELGDENLFIPAHKGYEQLVIVLEKQKDFEEAIALSEKAFGQGWAGDWQKRIERCRKKIDKQK